MTTHFADDRRPEGRRYSGTTRSDGTGYHGQINQYPVICAADIVEEHVSQGSRKPVTNDPKKTTCADCKERLG